MSVPIQASSSTLRINDASWDTGRDETIEIPLSCARSNITRVLLAICLLAIIGTNPIVEIDGTWTPGADSRSNISHSPNSMSSESNFPPAISAAKSGRLAPLLEQHRTAMNESPVRIYVTHEATRGALITAARWQRANQTAIVDTRGRSVIDVNGSLAPVTIGAERRPIDVQVSKNDSTCGSSGDWRGTRFAKTIPCAVVRSHGLNRLATRATLEYLHRYLNRTEPTVWPINNDSVGCYRLESTRAPEYFPYRPENYTAVAIVDERHVIRKLMVSYEMHGLSNGDRKLVYAINASNSSVDGDGMDRQTDRFCQ
jgi:hypothetical protein